MEAHKMQIVTPLRIDVYFDEIYLGSTCFGVIKPKYPKDLADMDYFATINERVEANVGNKSFSGEIFQQFSLEGWVESAVPEKEVSMVIEYNIACDRLNAKDMIEWLPIEVTVKISEARFSVYPSYANSRLKMCDISVPLIEVFEAHRQGSLTCDWLLAKFLNQSLANLKNA